MRRWLRAVRWLPSRMEDRQKSFDEAVGRGIQPLGPQHVVGVLADTLREVVRNPHAWCRRGEEGRRRAETLYGWDSKIQEMLKLYQEVAHREC